MAESWDKQALLDRFDAAWRDGYRKDDWHLFKVHALEAWGDYRGAISAAESALTKISDETVKAQLNAALARCKAWGALQAAQAELPAVIVTSAPAGSVAAKAGLKPGDRILRMQAAGEDRFSVFVDDAPVLLATWGQFLDTCDASVESATLTIRRDGKDIEITYPREALDATLFTLRAVE
jgi:hypothetical protein